MSFQDDLSVSSDCKASSDPKLKQSIRKLKIAKKMELIDHVINKVEAID
jgi:hypothetical protein